MCTLDALSYQTDSPSLSRFLQYDTAKGHDKNDKSRTRCWSIIFFCVIQSQKAQGFCVADFATLSDERRSRSKLFLLFIWIKEPCVRKFEGLVRSKRLGISQTKSSCLFIHVDSIAFIGNCQQNLFIVSEAMIITGIWCAAHYT